MLKIERLIINYKTEEDFIEFTEMGSQELSMLEDLEEHIIENHSESPFYGIYIGNKLVASMCLYKVEKEFNRFFEPALDYFEICKLEVLPNYQSKGLGTMLVDYAKSLGLPLKANGRLRSQEFWEKQGFQPAQYVVNNDLGTNPLIWFPTHPKQHTLN